MKKQIIIATVYFFLCIFSLQNTSSAAVNSCSAIFGLNKIWNNPKYYKEINGESYIVLSEYNLKYTFKIVRFNEEGNPVIKINARRAKTIPTQEDLKDFSEYERKFLGRDLTKFTLGKPIQVVVSGGTSFMKSIEFQIIDGHHRFYSAWLKKIDVHIELLEFDDLKVKGLTWKTIDVF